MKFKTERKVSIGTIYLYESQVKFLKKHVSRGDRQEFFRQLFNEYMRQEKGNG